MLTCSNDSLAEKIHLQRSHGMTSLTYDRHKGHAFSYDVVELGYNYRIDEIHSALGIQQLAKLEQNNQRRCEITQKYWKAFADTPLGLPFSKTMQGEPSFHIFPVLLPENVQREAFMLSLRDAGIQSSIHYRPIHTFSYYREKYGEIKLPVTDAVAAREVTLPLFPTMSDAQINEVIETVICLTE
jgi:dTDP-4-amino-4,6-dideoxygalactose transaminase